MFLSVPSIKVELRQATHAAAPAFVLHALSTQTTRRACELAHGKKLSCRHALTASTQERMRTRQSLK